LTLLFRRGVFSLSSDSGVHGASYVLGLSVCVEEEINYLAAFSDIKR